MHFTQVIQAVAILVAISTAHPSPNTHAVHEIRREGSSGYVKRARLESSAVIPVRIGLKQTGLDNAYEHLMDV